MVVYFQLVSEQGQMEPSALNLNGDVKHKQGFMYVEVLHTHDSPREDADPDLKATTPGPSNMWGVLVSLF